MFSLEARKISWPALGKTLSAGWGRWCPLCSVLVKPHLEYWLLVLGAPAQDMDFLGQVQEGVTKTAKGSQNLTWAKDEWLGLFSLKRSFGRGRYINVQWEGLKIKSQLSQDNYVYTGQNYGNGCKMMLMEFCMNTEQFFLLQSWSDTKTLPVKFPSSEMFIILLHTVLNNLLLLTLLEGGREVGLGSPKRFAPISTILWFCENREWLINICSE